ncbi:uncharacterized protein DUF2809 [Nonlabens dokdonensis]|jgi:hypothetical protein|uniref:DUF2809 domain-containing protein n=2 Tax=Nonlabens dokdonensis TaxID=328515 RepID=L7W9A1_NONDD|nr:DUF2809 domain-containing protein [Nonlabens dokdonensis]AGC75448.1 hypothetical protein DDD_0321 [Nonlabens dokdonensis DSW-6]PZX43145.1 uncharacterized protein DUF2809 [Nonlabens dokdonensis]
MNLPKLHRKPKKVYIIAALTLFVIEVLIEQYAHDDFIRPYLGDFFVVILIYSVVMSVSNFKVLSVAIATLLFSYAIEIAQYAQVVSLLGLEDYKIARIIIGTSFSWWDMLMYTLGILFVLIIEKMIAKLNFFK